ncbi:MAG: response regulator transcription factor [Anaerolineae bacterium]|nr:response regulator transcription factor [Anaerolineae bacterium]
MTRVLVINNDIMVLQTIQRSLENENYQVFVARSSQEGLELAWQTTPDIVILELDMPVMDGFEVCRRLRELSIQSILITSHLRDERSVVRALEMGADDYLRQPVEIPILLAKIRTLMRRNRRQTTGKISVYDDGQLLIDLDSRRVEMRGEPVKLTPTEFRLLAILLRRAGRVVAHEELIREVWGTDKDVGLGSLKLYIHYLRQKIEDRPRKPRYLLAEWGIGYRFREPARNQIPAAVTQLA